ncbi:MAG: GHKL domain-containing protein, partial [Campylobacterales bacterium]|nr:GHKL domain-containing protein [Campylobacterales bacterium]
DLAAAVPALEKLIDRDDLRVVTHSRMVLLVKHYGIKSKYYSIDEGEFLLNTKSGLTLQFITTPYCHSPGAFVTYEPDTKTLLSGDIFGGLEESWKFYADENYFNEVKLFHENFMPSRNILNYSLSKIEELDIQLIAPQHGSIVKKEFIKPLIEDMKKLECGIYIDKKYHTELYETIEKLEIQIKINRQKDMLLMEQVKFAQMREMMNMVAHQWRQPLNAVAASAINLSLNSMMENLEDAEVQKATTFIQEQVQKMSQTIDDFMDFHKESDANEFFVYEAVENVKKIVYEQINGRGIKLVTDVDRHLKVFHSRTSIEHSMLNIISNARDAFDEHKDIKDKIIKIYTKVDNDGLSLCIGDNAGGVKDEILSKIFNPYFSTKEQGKGTGVGLYITKEMVEKVKGSKITCRTSNGKTVFCIKFIKRQ